MVICECFIHNPPRDRLSQTIPFYLLHMRRIGPGFRPALVTHHVHANQTLKRAQPFWIWAHSNRSDMTGMPQIDKKTGAHVVISWQRNILHVPSSIILNNISHTLFNFTAWIIVDNVAIRVADNDIRILWADMSVWRSLHATNKLYIPPGNGHATAVPLWWP